MKTLLLIALIFLSSCTKDEAIAPECNYALIDQGARILVDIDSDKESVEMVLILGGKERTTVIRKNYYHCISVERSSTPMIFRIDGCEQSI